MSFKKVLVRATVIGCASVLLVSCGPSSEEFAELRKKQDEILAKLQKDIIPKIDKLAAARPPAPPARPARPGQPDPSKVYSFPAGDSPAKGPEYAWVTILEISDFQ